MELRTLELGKRSGARPRLPPALMLGSEVAAGSSPFPNAVSAHQDLLLVSGHLYHQVKPGRSSVAENLRHLEVSGLGRRLRRSHVAAPCHVYGIPAVVGPYKQKPCMAGVFSGTQPDRFVNHHPMTGQEVGMGVPVFGFQGGCALQNVRDWKEP